MARPVWHRPWLCHSLLCLLVLAHFVSCENRTKDTLLSDSFSEVPKNTKGLDPKVSECFRNSNLVTCMKFVLLKRVRELLDVRMLNKTTELLNGVVTIETEGVVKSDGVETLARRMEAWSVDGKDASREKELDVLLIAGLSRFFQDKALKLHVLPGVTLRMDPARTKKEYVRFSLELSGERLHEAMSRTMKMSSMVPSPMMMIGPMITLGLFPFMLANLNYMVMNAFMINNMALMMALRTTITNFVFGDNGNKVVYSNKGYENEYKQKKPGGYGLNYQHGKLNPTQHTSFSQNRPVTLPAPLKLRPSHPFPQHPPAKNSYGSRSPAEQTRVQYKPHHNYFSNSDNSHKTAGDRNKAPSDFSISPSISYQPHVNEFNTHAESTYQNHHSNLGGSDSFQEPSILSYQNPVVSNPKDNYKVVNNPENEYNHNNFPGKFVASQFNPHQSATNNNGYHENYPSGMDDIFKSPKVTIAPYEKPSGYPNHQSTDNNPFDKEGSTGIQYSDYDGFASSDGSYRTSHLEVDDSVSSYNNPTGLRVDDQVGSPLQRHSMQSKTDSKVNQQTFGGDRETSSFNDNGWMVKNVREDWPLLNQEPAVRKPTNKMQLSPEVGTVFPVFPGTQQGNIQVSSGIRIADEHAGKNSPQNHFGSSGQSEDKRFVNGEVVNVSPHDNSDPAISFQDSVDLNDENEFVNYPQRLVQIHPGQIINPAANRMSSAEDLSRPIVVAEVRRVGIVEDDDAPTTRQRVEQHRRPVNISSIADAASTRRQGNAHPEPLYPFRDNSNYH